MKNFSAVVDANLAVFCVIDSQHSPAANHAWNSLTSWGYELFAPDLWLYETTSVIRKYLAFGIVMQDEAQDALSVLAEFNVKILPDSLSLRRGALRWAELLRQKAAYDGFYLAAADDLGEEFWTADQALVNHTRQIGIEWTHWMGELS